MEWTIERAVGEGDPGADVIIALVSRTHAVAPQAVQVERSGRGRRARAGSTPVEVSLSRTPGWIAAVCSAPGESGAVGIDAEAWVPFRDSGTRASDFAAVVLSAEEREWFRAAASATESDRLHWLLRTWVRKEAVLKALGTGFDTARGGLDPAAIVLGPPWEDPRCTSHPQVELADRTAGPSTAPVLVSLAHGPDLFAALPSGDRDA